MCKVEKSKSTTKIRSKRDKDWLTPKPIFTSDEQQTIQPRVIPPKVKLSEYEKLFKEITNCFLTRSNNRF